MLLDKIKTAEILLETMNYYRDDLIAELESSGKREFFEQAVQILIAEVETAQTKEQVDRFTNNLEDLVDVIPEKVKANLITNVPDRDKIHLKYDEETEKEGQKWAELQEEWLKSREGIRQGLVTLVDDVRRPQTDDQQSLFDKILALLGLQRKQ